MKNIHERLRSPERASERAAEAPCAADSLSRERVVSLSARRTESLASLKGDITLDLYDAIADKIEYERQSLLEMIEQDAKAAQDRKQRSRALASEYFSLKPLDPHFI